jgi:ferrous iron transport protein B
MSLLFFMFQAVFAWAEAPMTWIDAGIGWLQQLSADLIRNELLQSLVVDGILAGVGSILVFLPQIIILFCFILLLEASGYMARAAFLLDRLMAGVGLNGRAFIPLLSSFACAVPGIMATRTIESSRDRLTTILIAPLMTCSARLPVYTLIIAAFVPNQAVVAGAGLQGIVLFCLYFVGIVSAILVAGILRLTVTRGVSQPMIMEMPTYKMPQARDILIGIGRRAKLFLIRAGTIILLSMVVLWALARFPDAPADATEPAITHSFAGMIGQAIQPLFAPIGFNWEIALALIPGMMAREVAVAALGTVYALSGTEEAVSQSLVQVLRSAWTVPTALAFLAWYVFAPQCIATLAVTRRETNSWRWPIFMFAYLVGLAYVSALITYRLALMLMG